jgi:hypothetical protein
MMDDAGEFRHGTGASAADERLDRLVAIIGRLKGALEGERTLFEARRPRELAGLISEKEALAELYAKEMRALGKERAWVEAASASARQRLQQAVGELRFLLGDYSRAILARRAVVEGLVRALGQEVARQRQPLTSYGAARPGGMGAPAIAFDQRA